MFIILVTYTAPLERIDQELEAHRAWVRAGYDDGVFLASGPQVPRTGGAILAHGLTRQELDARLARDPFNIAGLVGYQVTEVAVRAADERLEFLVG